MPQMMGAPGMDKMREGRGHMKGERHMKGRRG